MTVVKSVFQVRRDPRMSLLGTDLAISRVGVHDGGLYRSDKGHIPDMKHDISVMTHYNMTYDIQNMI